MENVQKDMKIFCLNEQDVQEISEWEGLEKIRVCNLPHDQDTKCRTHSLSKRCLPLLPLQMLRDEVGIEVF